MNIRYCIMFAALLLVAQNLHASNDGELPADTTASPADRPMPEDEQTEPPATPRFEVTGNMRFRTSLDRRRSASPLSDAPIDVHEFRTRGNLHFRPTSDITALLQIQDSRQFGSSRSTLGTDVTALDVHQAFFEVRDLASTGIDAKIGRQEIALGNQRLVGSVGWHPRGRTFDGLRLRRELGDAEVDLFATRTSDRDLRAVTPQDGPEHLFGFWGEMPIGEDNRISLFALYDNNRGIATIGTDSVARLRDRTTIGALFQGKAGPLVLEVDGAWQGGTHLIRPDGTPPGIAGVSQDLSAYFASAKLTVPIGDASVGALYTLLSGDDTATADASETFNTLFATNHKFYGYMDYFPVLSGRLGLQDVALMAAMKFSSTTSANVTGHYFMPHKGDDPFGIEVDAIVKHRYNDVLGFVFGASVFLPDDSIIGLFDEGENGYWGFVMVTVSL